MQSLDWQSIDRIQVNKCTETDWLAYAILINMIIQNLTHRIQNLFNVVADEEQQVDKQRSALASQKGFDAKQIYETVGFPHHFHSFLNHYQIENDYQFRNSFTYYYSGYVGFHLDYEHFLNFILPCEDEDLYNITKNKVHMGGVKSIFNFKTCEALRNLFYAEVHYHFTVERVKKELFRDFSYQLQHFPLMQFKKVSKSQFEELIPDEAQLRRVWRRLNCMNKREYDNESHECKFLKYMLFPEDYIEQLSIMKEPAVIEEGALSQYQKAKGYAKNNRTQKYIECPPNNNCAFYENFTDSKTYSSDKFVSEFQTSKAVQRKYKGKQF